VKSQEPSVTRNVPAGNKLLVVAYFEALTNGNSDAALKLLAEDLEWFVPGTNALAGTFTKADLEGFVAQAAFDGTIDFEIRNLTGEADRVAAEVIGRGRLVDGRNYENYYHFLFHIRDGRFVRVAEYLDSFYAVNIFTKV